MGEEEGEKIWTNQRQAECRGTRDLAARLAGVYPHTRLQVLEEAALEVHKIAFLSICFENIFVSFVLIAIFSQAIYVTIFQISSCPLDCIIH